MLPIWRKMASLPSRRPGEGQNLPKLDCSAAVFLWTEPVRESRRVSDIFRMNTVNKSRHPWMQPEPNLLYEFGPFVLDTVQHVLLRDLRPVAVTPKTYDALLVLVKNSGRMLTKEELMKAVWPDSFVEESNLTQQISTIRKTLGESPGEDLYIVTVAGRGYRFAAPVNTRSKPGSCGDGFEPELLDPAIAGSGDGAIQLVPAVEGRSLPGDADFRKAPGVTGNSVLARRWRAGLVTAVLLLGIGLAAGFYGRLSKPVAARPALQEPRRLAILPFRNLRQNPGDEFLGFSLADAVITKLGYVSALSVRPSSSIEKYRNEIIDIQKVSRELNVDTLLASTFIREGDDLRITSQLIDVKTEKLLWKGAIDLKYEKLLTVQDNVAQQIVKGLELNLSPSEAEQLKPYAPVGAAAYEYYLRGVDLYSRNDFPLAIKMLEKSAEIEPNYALTWAHLGRSYTADASFGLGGREQYRKAQAAYEKALALQPAQIEARIYMANLFTDTNRVEQAIPLLRQALQTNPNHAELHWELGYAYRFSGMLTDSVSECERARELDPGVKRNSSALNAYLYLGQYDKFLESLPATDDVAFISFYRGFGEYYRKNQAQAASNFDHAFELDPSLLQARIGKALSDAIGRQDAKARNILREAENRIEERQVGDPEARYKIAQAYAVLGDKESALKILQLCIENGFFSYPYFTQDPLLNSLRSQPRFAELMKMARTRHEALKSRFF
jgi:DNA-binding winged helix-turn-helix (wHTH) protein/TolB-like protein/Flp pilus assembly protein TadD